VLTEQDIAELGAVAKRHNLWLLVDEVYDEMVFNDAPFFTPLALPDLADQVIVVSSISKSHAAPGFRSGARPKTGTGTQCTGGADHQCPGPDERTPAKGAGQPKPEGRSSAAGIL
jgi:hypothetical protein